MKRFNKYMNLLNIITIIIFIITYVIQDFLIYEATQNVILVLFYIVAIANIINAIINLAKRNTKVGILQIILGIIMTVGTTVGLLEKSFVIFVISSIISVILSIVNIFLNSKLEDESNKKIYLVIFILFTLLEICTLAVPAIMNTININNLENALDKLKQDEDLNTYYYTTEDGKTVFIDENANQISENDYKIITSILRIKIDDKLVDLNCAIQDNKVFIINSKGEKIFELCKNWFGGEDETKDIVHNFFDYVCYNEVLGITQGYTTDDEFDEYKSKEPALYRFVEDMSRFEDNQTSEYMYFRNDALTNQILQIELTNIESDDKGPMNIYLENIPEANANKNVTSTGSYIDISEYVEKFYTNKKNYYLIDLNTNEKVQLECNNLIYEAYYDEQNNLIERILLYSNGSIPYYDTNSAGYFELNGRKHTIDNKYILQDVTDYFEIVKEKDSNISYAMNRDVNKYNLAYGGLQVYNNFYIISDNILDGYQILDKNFNFLARSKNEMPNIYSENLFVCVDEASDGTKTFNNYYYDGTQLKLLDTNGKQLVAFSISGYEQRYIEDGYDESVYSKIGLIQPDFE